MASLAFCPARAYADEADASYYIDTSGKRVAFRPIYEGWFGDARYRPRVGRAIAENTIMLGFELILYWWYLPDQNAVDWQYPNFGKKFSSNELVRFDDNLQSTNFVLHPFGGGAHYGFTRLNGFGVPKESWLLDRHDYFGVLHILGPVANLWRTRGPLRLRFGADIAPDFASIRPPAYEEWVARFGAAGTKSSLLRHGYYNAWGVSMGLAASASAEGFVLRATGRLSHYESIDGLERFAELVTREPHMKDDILELSGSLGYDVPRTPLSLRLEATHLGRSSTMPPVSVGRFDQSLSLAFGIRL